MANVKQEVWRRNGRDIERIRAWEVIGIGIIETEAELRDR